MLNEHCTTVMKRVMSLIVFKIMQKIIIVLNSFLIKKKFFSFSSHRMTKTNYMRMQFTDDCYLMFMTDRALLCMSFPVIAMQEL